jgi:hypothetical protein
VPLESPCFLPRNARNDFAALSLGTDDDQWDLRYLLAWDKYCISFMAKRASARIHLPVAAHRAAIIVSSLFMKF